MAKVAKLTAVKLSETPSLELQRLRLLAGRAIADTLLLVICFAAAGKLYLGDISDPAGLDQAWLLVPIFGLVALQSQLYSLETLSSIQLDFFRILVVVGLSSALFAFITFYTKTTADYSRATFTIAILGFVFFALSYRFFFHHFIVRSGRLNVENVLVIRAGGPDIELANAMVVDAREHELTPDFDNPEYFDHVGKCFGNMDRVIVSCGIEHRALWASILRATGVKGEVVSLAVTDLGAFGIEREDNFSTLVVSSRPLTLLARATKRLMDLAIAFLALLLLAPVMLAVALAIKLEDGGPVFFSQQRVGRSNRFFRVLKFRSMYAENLDAHATQLTAADDIRVTRVGKFIRRTSIDELPQLINVLIGEMSLVGPRPHALGAKAGGRHYWQVDARYWQRHSLRPGLTGLAQIRGYRGTTAYEEDLVNRVASDLEYIAKWSPWFDLVIIVMTIRVLIHENAY